MRAAAVLRQAPACKRIRPQWCNITGRVMGLSGALRAGTCKPEPGHPARPSGPGPRPPGPAAGRRSLAGCSPLKFALFYPARMGQYRVMDDVLSQGGDRERSQWPRRLAAIAVLVVLVAVLAWHLPRGRAAPAHSSPAAITAGPVQLAGLGSGAAGLLNGTGLDHRAGLAMGRPGHGPAAAGCLSPETSLPVLAATPGSC
jgi:hypothetical protein